MKKQGPQLDYLINRLADCPPEFMLQPKAGKNGKIDMSAVVTDFIRDLSPSPFPLITYSNFIKANKDINYLKLVLLCCWLLHDEWFTSKTGYAADSLKLLQEGLPPMAKIVKAEKFINDAERREELVRYCLMYLNLRPQGETKAHAEDRLKTMSSVARNKFIKDSVQVQKRLQAIRKAMAKKAAAEAASKATRE
ncbi:hypothetical protein ACFL35_06445 [Candidatus Riflebacteria bacterium]